MSIYTTQLRYIIDEANNFDSTLSWRDKIDNARKKIFDFDYPIWNEEHKKELEKKILTHYFNYEIGLETAPLWKLYLEEKMNEIMPYYVDMYNAIYPNIDKLYVNREYQNTEIQNQIKNVTTNDNRDVNTTNNSSSNLTNDKKIKSDRDINRDESLNSIRSIDENNTDNITKDITNTSDKSENVSNDVTKTINNTDTKNENGTNDTTTTTNNSDNKTTNIDDTITEDETRNNLQIVSDLPQTTLKNLDYATQSTSDEGNRHLTKTDDTDKTENDIFTGNEVVRGTSSKDISGTFRGSETVSDTVVKSFEDNLTGKETVKNVGNKTTDDNKTDTNNIVIDDNLNETNNTVQDTTSQSETGTTEERKIINDIDSELNTTFKTYGLNGKTYSELIAEYLPVIQNIDMKIIKALKPLFMLVF